MVLAFAGLSTINKFVAICTKNLLPEWPQVRQE